MGRVNDASGNVHALARAVSVSFAVLREGHFAIEDDVGGECRMGVIGVEGAGAVLPGVNVGEALGAELLAKSVLVHDGSGRLYRGWPQRHRGTEKTENS